MADAQPQTAPDTSNIGAIIGGMGLAPARDQTSAPLPDILQPGYQPPQPPALQPPQGPVSLQPPPTPPQSAPPQPAPAQPALQPPTQPQVATASQPGPPPRQSNLPWPAANPNSPTFRSAQDMPALPGETPQETQQLNAHAWHETGARGNIINDLAARNPALYTDKDNPRTGQGYWQDVNSTWAAGARLAGVDLRQFPSALTADYWTQRRVNLALYRAYGDEPWKPHPDAGEVGDRFALRPQLPLPPERRDQQDWGSPPPRSFGPGPEGRPFGQAAFMQPGQSGFTRVLNAIGPLLMGIGSLALHLPLSTAITAYGAMAKAQDNGQREAYERARTQFQDQLKEANAQQTLESQAASDAFAEYGTNNPEGLQQQLARIALQYNDPTMYRMAERGDLNGIHQLQTKRDQYNQDLTKLNKANEDAQDRKAQDDAVAAMDRQYLQDHLNATADELAIAHNENIGKAARAGTKDAKGESTAEEAKVYNVVDKDTGKPTGKQVRVGRNGGMFDLNGQPTTLAPNEKLGDEAGVKATDDKLSEPKAYDVVGKDGKVVRTVNLRDRKSGPGFEDAETGQPFTHGPDEQLVPHVAQKPPDEKLSEPKAYDVIKDGKVQRTVNLRDRKSGPGFEDAETGQPFTHGPDEQLVPHTQRADDTKLSEPKAYDVMKDGKVQRTVMLRDRKTGPGFEDAETGEPFQRAQGETLQPHTASRAGAEPPYGSPNWLMNRWHEQFVKEQGREPTNEEVAKQRQEYAQEVKPTAMSARLVSQRLGIAIGEASGGVAALTQLSANATLGPWGGAQAALTTNSIDNFKKSLTNRFTSRESRMMNSIAKVIARPLASLEAAGVATGLVGVTQSLQTEFPQEGDDGYTVLTKLANIRNIVDAAADQLVIDKSIDPAIRQQISDHRDKVDAAIPYTLDTVVNAEVNPNRENMRGLAERLLHRTPTRQSGGGLPPGVTVEVH